MRVVVQRVKRASVAIDGQSVGRIGPGLLVLLGIRQGDSDRDADALARKLCELRIFPDGEGKMNLSVLDAGHSVLVVSQFTLYGDCRKGRRPSFLEAARPEEAVPLYERFLERVRSRVDDVQTGRFGARMEVELVNDGPVTLLLDAP